MNGFCNIFHLLYLIIKPFFSERLGVPTQLILYSPYMNMWRKDKFSINTTPLKCVLLFQKIHKN